MEDAERKEKKHSPHGLPLSNEEYERLKSRARYTKATKTSIAQQDPSTANIEE
jgi:hypothetical protein